MQTLEDKIIGLLSRRKKRSLTRRELAERLDLHGRERKLLSKALERLNSNGTLQERRGGYRLLPQQQRTLEGLFSLADKGYGFLRLDEEQKEDLFIPARYVGSAMEGDRVQVSCHVSPRDRRHYAKVLKVVQRAHKRMIGFYQQRGKGAEVWPLNKKLGGQILVSRSNNVNPGEIVEVEISQYAHGDIPARGEIVEVIGAANNPQVDIETVIRSHDLPHRFSDAALAQAEIATTSITPEEIVERVDLRHLPLVTIDGETAKDFDDAVALQTQADGSWKLWVAIADVSHYVTPQSPLDIDAIERGTSVYFPGFCLPMLPAALSNGICSLNPDEERLVMTAELLFSADGTRLESNFYPAVIRSHARLTYTQVSVCLQNPAQSDLDIDLIPQLQQMVELATALGQKRQLRGSLDLDLPEVEVVLDSDGAPIDLVKTERTMAHRLIEEFMLAANEAVADYLTEKGWNFLYRIHEEPDLLKLQELQQLAAQCGVGLVLGKKLQTSLQQLLIDIADKPEARLISQQLLRSLQQACYSPVNSGHFGLATDCYCHFTSPIRRYPDLVVHRILKLALSEQPQSASLTMSQLTKLGLDCSTKERRAMQAERDLVNLRCCQVISKRLGEEFSGTISSVTEFGFFVELDGIYVEGLVHLRTLQDDYYHFDSTTMTLVGEHRRNEFRVGMPVKVKVAKVELWRRRIDFSLLENANSRG
ncbi:RNAse R [Desulfuromusa kysingii]|uniref:Ribonuclease R n=1 Tax=Desulfuromusa kysingii TaxID=37625 RepID=A0A1H4AQG7_9BACT|nr:ribonuclease R [Desulfuromusa kysingii]SEA37987.1 RNAse R [Desulfuromusa kysingii]